MTDAAENQVQGMHRYGLLHCLYDLYFLSRANMTPRNRVRLIKLLRRLRGRLDEYRVTPRALVGTVLHAWTQVAFPQLAGPSLPNRPDLLQLSEVGLLVEKLVALPLLESAYWLSSAYSVWSDEDYRKELAMFFTPPSLTNRLLDDVQIEGADFGVHTFFDPACGGAAFLAPIALRMRNALRVRGLSPSAILEHIEGHLFGSDVDETLCELSRHFLRMALSEEIAATGRELQLKVHRADSLWRLQNMLGQFDVVVCNPPYRKLRSQEVASLQVAFSEVLEAQPNLYAVFMAQTIRFLRRGGLAALVTPTSFLSGRYFSCLRRYLIEQSDILSIGMVSDRRGVFIDVEHETALTVLRRQAPEETHREKPKIAVVGIDGVYHAVGTCLLPASGETWRIPRSESDAELLQQIGRVRFRLADYGYVVRIGSFVWNRDTRPVFDSLSHVRRSKSKSAVPLLWSRNIRPSGALIFNERAKSSDEPCFVDLGDSRHPSVVRNPSVILQRVTSNDQPRRLVASAVPGALLSTYGGYVGENHTVILEQVTDAPALDTEKLARVLGTHLIDRAFRCISSSTNVSIYELNQLALPDPAVLARLIESGLDIEDAVTSAYGYPVDLLEAA